MCLFTEREARALCAPEKLSPSEWAEAYRYLAPTIAAEPGKYRGDRTPYIAGLIDSIQEPGVEEIVFLKAAQVGFTTALQHLLGWIIDQEPAPTLLVMPSDKESRKLVDENLKPLIEQTEQLQAHVPPEADAITKETLRFDSCSLFMASACSPQTLARRACRFVFMDEVDKYPKFSGKDADPISLARARARTYKHRKRVIIGSTPTTREGAVWRAWEDCSDRRRYHVPCPHCGEFQTLNFGQVRFDFPEVKAIGSKSRRADYIESRQVAHYECVHCKEAIRDSHKQAMLLRGAWLSETQTISRAGEISGERPRAKRVGFHLSALYSPWVSFSDMAAAFTRALGDAPKMMEFKNQWLAEVFEELIKQIKAEDLRDQLLKGAAAAGIVPKWAHVVVTTVDVQQHTFYLVTRAWGAGNRSRLIWLGNLPTFEMVKKRGLDTPYPVEGGGSTTPQLLAIDTGYRTDEVYDFASTDARIQCVKGNPNPKKTILRSQASVELGIELALLDTQYYKDRLITLRSEKRWEVNVSATDEYFRHLAAEMKVRDRKNGRFVWKPVSEGAANHFLDCEVYQVAAADMLEIATLPDEEEQPVVPPPPPPQVSSVAPPPATTVLHKGDGQSSWVTGGSGGDSWVGS
jgi:phage terminase large subunit GpA-like protein